MDKELIHYGVLGMKWGRRKGRVASDDHITTAKIRKKKIYEMSNKDLQTANNRLQLERNYKSLTKKASVGRKAVTTFVKTAGTITAVAAAAKVYKKFGNAAIDKIGDLIIKNIKL